LVIFKIDWWHIFIDRSFNTTFIEIDVILCAVIWQLNNSTAILIDTVFIYMIGSSAVDQ